MRVSSSALTTLTLGMTMTIPTNAQQQYKCQTPMPPGIATLDKVETSIGTLNLKDGYPRPTRLKRSTTTSTGGVDRSQALGQYATV
jgi:hypothetical protein